LITACLSLAALGALLGLAGAALAGVSPSSGGTDVGGGIAPTSAPGTTTVPGTTTTPGTTLTPGTTTMPGAANVLQVGGLLTVSGGGITMESPRIALLHGTVSFTGSVSQAKAGDTVVIQRQGALPGYWVTAASATAGTDGAFDASWHVNQSGSLHVRAVLNSLSANVAAARRATARAITLAATPTLTLTVYRGAIATIFGPGFFGHRTACGERLTRTTIGVANRTLPCGSMVAIYYRGRQLDVPVIDRGPYAYNASWDLTLATAKALGINETVRIGALSPPPAH